MSVKMTTLASAKNMRTNYKLRIKAPILALILSLIVVFITLAHGPDDKHAKVNSGAGSVEAAELSSGVYQQAAPSAHGILRPEAACSGGTAPAVEGITLTECYQRNVTVGGNPRIIRVWYTTDTSTYTVDDVSYVHGILGESQAIDVADAVQESWEAVFAHSAIGGHTAHEPYINGCSSVLNILMRDGKGWSGIAYWASSGTCNIGIDAPMVLNGVGTGDDGVIFHEVRLLPK